MPGPATLPTKERLILERLVEAPAFGQQLVDQSGGALKRGTVYVTLSRMEAKGLSSRRSKRLSRQERLDYRDASIVCRLANHCSPRGEIFQQELTMEAR